MKKWTMPEPDRHGLRIAWDWTPVNEEVVRSRTALELEACQRSDCSATAARVVVRAEPGQPRHRLITSLCQWHAANSAAPETIWFRVQR